MNMNSHTQDKCSIFSRRFYLSKCIVIICFTYFVGILNVFAMEDSTRSSLKITIKPLSELLISAEQSVAATVISLNKPILRAQINAKVNNIHTEIGDYVKQNAVLLTLDCREYDYALQQAKARHQARELQIALLKKNYQRDKRLLQQSTISQTRFDQSENDYLSANVDINALAAQRDLARLQVERCHIKAPFAGKIIQRQVQKGQLVSSQTALFTLIQTDNLQISADVSNAEISSLQQTKQIQFRQNKVNNRVKINTIVALADEKNRTQEVRLTLLDPSHHLVTGSAGRIVWQNPFNLLKAAYVSQRNNQLGVFIIKDKANPQAIFIPLSHAQEGRNVKVDLPLNSLIIDAGRLQAQDQQRVELK